MRRRLRPSSCLLGMVALVSVTLMAASASAASLPRVASTPTRAAASTDHATFLGVIDARPSGALADLIGLLPVAAMLVVVWGTGMARVFRLSVAPVDARRRWWARLVGAPPAAA